jgi:hypothetical protein
MRQTPLSEHPVADGQMAGGIVEKTNYRLLNSTCLIAWESTNSVRVPKNILGCLTLYPDQSAVFNPLHWSQTFTKSILECS